MLLEPIEASSVADVLYSESRGKLGIKTQAQYKNVFWSEDGQVRIYVANLHGPKALRCEVHRTRDHFIESYHLPR